jgi:hypothetical protein
MDAKAFEEWRSGVVGRAIKDGVDVQRVQFDWPTLEWYFLNHYTPKQAWREVRSSHYPQ